MDALTTQALEVLRAVRARLDDPQAWTQGASALDAAGNDLQRGDKPEAVSFCVGCAIDVEAHRLFGTDALSGGEIGRRADCLLMDLPMDTSKDDACDAVVSFNDAKTTSHADVIARLDRAIARKGKTA